MGQINVRSAFHKELLNIRDDILRMGSLVDHAIGRFHGCSSRRVWNALADDTPQVAASGAEGEASASARATAAHECLGTTRNGVPASALKVGADGGRSAGKRRPAARR